METAKGFIRSCICLCGNPRALLMRDVKGNPYIKCTCGRTFLGDENLGRFIGYLLIEKMVKANLSAHRLSIEAALEAKQAHMEEMARRPKRRSKKGDKS